jgi:hypothetical protein
MPKLIDHELKYCQAIQSELVREVRETQKKELDDQRKKILELEENLSLEKGLHSITLGDNARLIAKKEKLITDLEHRIKEDEQKNTELWKMVNEKVRQLADLTIRNDSVAQPTNELVGPNPDSDRLLRQKTTQCKFYFLIFIHYENYLT